ncbi:hypothetical protein KCU65_g5694, partial [Aureobasidium melanogenum]
MAAQSVNASQEPKSPTTDKEVINETAEKTVHNEKTTTNETNTEAPVESSHSTTTDSMPDDNNAEETAEPKARFRKGNMFINAEQANAYFNKKK